MAILVPMDDDDLTKVDASPTKEFFVDIITKDIQLDHAILDLIDNCVDGAKRIRPGDEANYSGLSVDIEVTDSHFVIADNCGGIPLEVARKYAFKFGRAKGFVRTSHSVGQFGVGMKRALFKMGHRFNVSSVDSQHKFRVEVDVAKWSADEFNWDFDIKGLTEGSFDVDQTGTRIEIDDLDASVAETFAQHAFVRSLRQDIRVAQQHPMRLGLNITLNGEAIIPTEWQLQQSDNIEPSYRRFEDDVGGEALLITRLYAGIGESSRAHAGWYVFCNGRCILEADQDPITGWDESDAGVEIPKYHGQFARFRGYAFLDSDDSSILPWNTTKTGLDLEADAYRRLRGRLIEATRPVINFLNNLDAEKDFEEADKILSQAVRKSSAVALETLTHRPTFVYTQPPRRRGPTLTKIAYRKPQAEADKLKEVFEAQSNRELGEEAFDYAYANLVEED